MFFPWKIYIKIVNLFKSPYDWDCGRKVKMEGMNQLILSYIYIEISQWTVCVATLHKKVIKNGEQEG
jgi:hypothetical protein